MKKLTRYFLLPIAVATQANAVVIFEDGSSHVIDSEINDFVYVFDSFPAGDPTHVTFNTGTNITGSDSEDDSLYVSDFSSATINDGTFAEDVVSDGFATIEIFDGTLGDDLQAFFLSTISVFGGSIADDVEAFGASFIEIFDGTIGDDVIATGISLIEIFGGSITDDVEAFGGSLIEIFGGSIGEDIEAFDDGIIDISGGSLGSSLRATNRSLIVLRGSEFSIDGTPVGPGDIAQSSGLISGTLDDGSSFSDVAFDIRRRADIRLIITPVPDGAPGAIGMLSLLAVLFARSLVRRKR